MVSKVSFGLDDGRTITCPDSSLLIFIDDTGHEGLRDREFPFLALVVASLSQWTMKIPL